MTKWKTIDTAPIDGTTVLVCWWEDMPPPYAPLPVMSAHWSRLSEKWCGVSGYVNPTHWTPMLDRPCADEPMFINGAITDAYESGWRPDGFGGAPLRERYCGEVSEDEKAKAHREYAEAPWPTGQTMPAVMQTSTR